MIKQKERQVDWKCILLEEVDLGLELPVFSFERFDLLALVQIVVKMLGVVLERPVLGL